MICPIHDNGRFKRPTNSSASATTPSPHHTMPSLSDLMAAERRMTAAEYDDLHRRGYKPDVINFLRDRGFREAGEIRNDDHTTSPTFLRQTMMPHLHIAVHPGDTLDDLLSAIYDMAWTDGANNIASAFNNFLDRVKRPRRSSETERSIDQRLTALELKLGTESDKDQATR